MQSRSNHPPTPLPQRASAPNDPPKGVPAPTPVLPLWEVLVFYGVRVIGLWALWFAVVYFKKTTDTTSTPLVIALAGVVLYWWGYRDGRVSKDVK